jgi:hypothetical protein
VTVVASPPGLVTWRPSAALWPPRCRGTSPWRQRERTEPQVGPQRSCGWGHAVMFVDIINSMVFKGKSTGNHGFYHQL